MEKKYEKLISEIAEELGMEVEILRKIGDKGSKIAFNKDFYSVLDAFSEKLSNREIIEAAISIVAIGALEYGMEIKNRESE